MISHRNVAETFGKIKSDIASVDCMVVQRRLDVTEVRSVKDILENKE